VIRSNTRCAMRSGFGSTATVAVSVTGVNDAPVAMVDGVALMRERDDGELGSATTCK